MLLVDRRQAAYFSEIPPDRHSVDEGCGIPLDSSKASTVSIGPGQPGRLHRVRRVDGSREADRHRLRVVVGQRVRREFPQSVMLVGESGPVAGTREVLIHDVRSGLGKGKRQVTEVGGEFIDLVEDPGRDDSRLPSLASRKVRVSSVANRLTVMKAPCDACGVPNLVTVVGLDRCSVQPCCRASS